MARIADVLRGSGKKPEKLASLTGLSVERINGLLLGAEPNVAELAALARALHLSLADFAPPTEGQSKALVLFRRGRGKERPGAELEIETLSSKVNRFLELLSTPSGDPL